MFRKIIEKLKNIGKNTVYYEGCLTKYALPEIKKNYEKILDKLNIDYIEIENLNCCGLPVRNAGYKEDFLKLIKKNEEIFREYNVGKIITSCPSCYSTFKEFYKVNVEHITVTIFNNVKKLKFRKVKERITYHDPCHLGRYSNIYEEPRDILRKIGYEIVEMKHNRESSLCCGAGGGVRVNFEELSKEIAKIRIEEAKACKVKMLITSCPLCYLQLKEAAGNSIKVKEISEVIIDALQ